MYLAKPALKLSKTSQAVAVAIAAVITVVGSASQAAALSDARNVSPGINADSLTRISIGDYSCSGTLITPEWVLTAAHCVVESDSANVTVGPFKYGATFQATEAIIHPQADLAVIRLAGQASSQTANLSGDHLQTGTKATATGWGGWPSQGYLIGQQADLEVQRRITNLPSPDPSSTLIEAAVNNGRLARGDSGGPLLINGQVAGVLSMTTIADPDGQASDTEGTMGFYVPVAEYTDWISRHTGKPIPEAHGTPQPVHDVGEEDISVPPVRLQPSPLRTGIPTIDNSIRSLIVGSA